MMKNWVKFFISLSFRTCTLILEVVITHHDDDSVEAALGLSL